MKGFKAAVYMVLCVMLLAPCVMAARPALSDVTYAADDQGDSISLQEVGGERYLFLPSTADLTALTLTFEGGPAALTAGDRQITVQSGQPFDLAALYSKVPSNGVYSFTLSADGVQLPVKLMVSQNISSMYITSADPANKGRDYVEEVKGNKASGRMTLIGADGRLIYSGELSQIKGRGNSTWKAVKKPYQIKLGSKFDLLENGEKAKTWVLLANYYDGAFVRNSLSFDLAAELGLPYSPHASPVDLYYDGEYRGTYLLCEKTEIGSSRVDINDLEGDFEDANPEVKDFDDLPTAKGTNAYGNEYQYVTGLNDPEDITGGYLLEMDFSFRAEEEKSWFATSHDSYIVSKSPEYLSRSAIEYISGFYQEFEDAVWNGGVNPTTGKSYTDYVDLESLVRCYVLAELTKDGDVFYSSTFFYKPEGEEKLYAGPVWDFDTSYGNDYYIPSDTFLVVERLNIAQKLLDIPSFHEAVEAAYDNELVPLVADVLLGANPDAQTERLRSLDEYQAEVAASLRMNNLRWSRGNQNAFPAAVDDLRDFLVRRSAYLSSLNWGAVNRTLAFTDISTGDWYFPAVTYVVGEGLFTGTDSSLFSPDDTMTRAMAATVLYRLAGEPGAAETSSFLDVPQGQWYSNAISWAADAGVVEGYPDGNFDPDGEITRQELVTMLYRYAEHTGADLDAPEIPEQYLDRDSIDDWAVNAFAWAVDRGIVSGTDSHELSPGGNALRCMAATILQRYSEMLA